MYVNFFIFCVFSQGEEYTLFWQVIQLEVIVSSHESPGISTEYQKLERREKITFSIR